MAINPDKLLALTFPEIRHEYSWRDSILYGLGVGCGLDPLDENALKYVDETRLRALPTMANVLAYPGFWMRDLDTGIDWRRVVHGEQAMRLLRPLPAEGTVTGSTRITDLIDKGEGRGALVYVERAIADAGTGETLAILNQTVFCRGDGGFGGAARSVPKSATLPDRPADAQTAIATHPQQALIYRLSGDYNPLHSDPQAARAAGFDRPILHGLATFGIAGRALTGHCCEHDETRFKALSARFSAPVFPGETIAFDIWHTAPGEAMFQARVDERDALVLANGHFTYGDGREAP